MPLVANDGSWAICLPKKTGSQSLAGMLEAAGAASMVGEFHGCEWDGDGRRLMVVRDPRERLASMYWWSKDQMNFCNGPGGPDEWLERFLECRRWNKPSYHEWTLSQSEMAVKFRPVEVFKLEDGLQRVLDAIGVQAEMRWANRTAGKRSIRKPFAETFTTISDELSEWLKLDAGEWY